jgi:tRNA-dihydrouridine synthase A
VFALRRDFPHLHFSLNGVVESCHHAAQVLNSEAEGARVQGVMIGRAAYNTPWDCLADADVSIFGASSNAALSRRQVGPHNASIS